MPLINAEKLITVMEIMPNDTKWYSYGKRTIPRRSGDDYDDYIVSNLYGESKSGDKCVIIGMMFLKNKLEKTNLTA